MLLSYQWLKRYLDLDIEPAELVKKLTMCGLETLLTDEGTAENPVIEVEITPNRADCLSAKGVTREIATLFDLKIKEQEIDLSETGDNIKDYISVEIDDLKRCPQYSARMIRGVKIGPSPTWLADLLTSAGLRPINNVVDITNFILLDEGQPLHAFDYDRIGSKKIVVRTAKDGDKFTTLDEKERVLTSEDLLITNGEKGLALAGIMGGLESEVEDDTTNILLESAYFENIGIRKTSRKIGLKTDSSHRFGHGVDPEQVSKSLDRAGAMIAELAGGNICKGIAEVKGEAKSLRNIKIRAARVKQILGIDIGLEGIESIMKRLNFSYKTNSDSLDVTIPSYCTDIDREIDLIEEIARLHGYNNIPQTLPDISTVAPAIPPRMKLEKDLRGLLSGSGLSEAINYSFIGDDIEDVADDTIELKNPINQEMSFMRHSLLIRNRYYFGHKNIENEFLH
jgi:phenylalanyl-tRNA synthetase beta chain